MSIFTNANPVEIVGDKDRTLACKISSAFFVSDTLKFETLISIVRPVVKQMYESEKFDTINGGGLVREILFRR